MKPTLQITANLENLNDAIKMVKNAVSTNSVGWISIGKKLIKSNGLHAVKEFKKRFPEKHIIVDISILGRSRTLTSVTDAGTDILMIPDYTSGDITQKFIEEFKKNGIETMVDLTKESSRIDIPKKLEKMGIDYIIVSLDDLEAVSESITIPIAVKIDPNREDVSDAVNLGAQIIVLDESITKKENIKEIIYDVNKTLAEIPTPETEPGTHEERQNIHKNIHTYKGYMEGKPLEEMEKNPTEYETTREKKTQNIKQELDEIRNEWNKIENEWIRLDENKQELDEKIQKIDSEWKRIENLKEEGYLISENNTTKNEESRESEENRLSGIELNEVEKEWGDIENMWNRINKEKQEAETKKIEIEEEWKRLAAMREKIEQEQETINKQRDEIEQEQETINKQRDEMDAYRISDLVKRVSDINKIEISEVHRKDKVDKLTELENGLNKKQIEIKETKDGLNAKEEKINKEIKMLEEEWHKIDDIKRRWGEEEDIKRSANGSLAYLQKLKREHEKPKTKTKEKDNLTDDKTKDMINRLIDLVDERGEIKLKDAAKELQIQEYLARRWTNLLEKRYIIEVKTPLVGDIILKRGANINKISKSRQ